MVPLSDCRADGNLPTPPDGALRLLVIVLGVALLVLLAGSVVSAEGSGATALAQDGTNDSVSITTGDNVTTPPETVTIEGEEFSVASIARVAVGDELAVTVTAPQLERYELNVYTLDERIQTFETGEANQSFTFETGTAQGGDLPPGSYVIAVVDNQDVKAVKPLVVADRGITLSAPDQVEQGEEFSVSATVHGGTAETTLELVELVVWNGETRERLELTETGTGTFEGNLSDLPAGTAEIYAVAIDEERIGGEKNAIGVSSPLTVEVGSESGTPAMQETNPIITGDGANGADDSSTGQADEDASTVISPTENDTDADDDGAGLGVLVALVGLGSILGTAGWRRRQGRTT